MSVDAKNLLSSTPRQAVIFYPYKYHFGPLAQDHPDDTIRIDATSSVLSISVSDNKNSASGTFSIVLAPDQNWPNRVRQGDWLLIYISQFGLGTDDGSDPTKGLRVLGNIDRISKQRSIGMDGKKRTTYKIVGRNFGKIFEKTQFYYNPYIPDFIQTNLVISKSGFMKFTGTPAEFLYSYLNLFYGDGFEAQISGVQVNQKTKTPESVTKSKKIDEMDQVRIPQAIYKLFGIKKKTGKLMDILKIEIGTGELTPDGYSLYIPPDQTINANFWEILKKVSNPLINELYTCMKRAKDGRIYPTIVLRKQPYSQKSYPKISRLKLPDSIIQNEDLGFSDHERYNYINFDPKSPFIAEFAQYMATSQAKRTERYKGQDVTVPLFPFIDRVSIQRYGFSTMGNLTTDFCFIPEAARKAGSKDLDINLAERWMRLLIDWWSNYTRTESGTFTIKGFNEKVEIDFFTDDQLSLSNDLKAPTMSIPGASPPNLLGNSINELTSFGSSATSLNRPTPQGHTTINLDHITVGDNVFLSDRNRLYHLEGFDLDWIAPGESTATFVVTRGVYCEDKAKTFTYLDDLKFKENAFEQTETSVTTTFPKRSVADKGGKK